MRDRATWREFEQAKSRRSDGGKTFAREHVHRLSAIVFTRNLERLVGIKTKCSAYLALWFLLKKRFASLQLQVRGENASLP